MRNCKEPASQNQFGAYRVCGGQLEREHHESPKHTGLSADLTL